MGSSVGRKVEEVTNIFSAVANHDLDEVKELALKHGLDVLNEEGDPLLVYAVKMGEKRIVQWLLSEGANWYIKDAQGDMGLHWAVKNGNFELVQLLCSDDFCVDEGGRGDSAALDHAVDKKGKDGFTALNYAVKLNHTEIAKYLIMQGSSILIPNDIGDAPWRKIDEEGGELFVLCDEVDLLFDAIYDDDLEALKKWVGKTSLKVVGSEDLPPLVFSALSGRTRLVSWLLDQGADMYARNWFDDTAFHLAAKKGCFEMVKLFCEHGIDIDIKGQEDFTALNYALWMDHDDIAEYLIKKGASLDIPDITNMTPRSQMEKSGKKYL